MAIPAVAVESRRPNRPLKAVPTVPSAGDTVLAEDGVVGNVQEILRTDAGVPAYVIVRVRGLLRRRYPVVPWPLVVTVDGSRGIVRMQGSSEVITHLPETIPIVL